MSVKSLNGDVCRKLDIVAYSVEMGLGWRKRVGQQNMDGITLTSLA